MVVLLARVEHRLAGKQEVSSVLSLSSLGGPVSEDAIYRGHRGRSAVGADSFVHQSLADLPGEYGGILALVLFNLVHHHRRGHLRLGAADNGSGVVRVMMMVMVVAIVSGYVRSGRVSLLLKLVVMMLLLVVLLLLLLQQRRVVLLQKRVVRPERVRGPHRVVRPKGCGSSSGRGRLVRVGWARGGSCKAAREAGYGRPDRVGGSAGNGHRCGGVAGRRGACLLVDGRRRSQHLLPLMVGESCRRGRKRLVI